MLFRSVFCAAQPSGSSPAKTNVSDDESVQVSDSSSSVKYESNKNGNDYIKMNGEYVLCPVMGHKGTRNLYSDYEGKRYFFCCGGCAPAFNSDPESYVEQGATGVPLEDLPTEE